MMRWASALGVLVLILAACLPDIPATTPPQLGATAGAPISVDRTEISTTTYRLRYPQGWRVVKANPAQSLTYLVFVSPDEQIQIQLSEMPLALAPTPSPEQIQQERWLNVGGVHLYGRLIAPRDLAEPARQYFAALLASLRPLSAP